MPHQQVAFDRFADQDWAAFIMEMRLGKTITSIRWCQHRLKVAGIEPGCEQVLVVAPSTPLVSWQEELEKESLRWTMIKGEKKKREKIMEKHGGGEAGWYLIQYETLLHTSSAWLGNWHAILLDESTAVKNPRAQITKVAVRELSTAPIRAILTGLTNPESLLEVWTQMAFASGGEWMGCSNYWTWQQRHFFKAGFDIMARPGSAKKIKEQFHVDGHILTRQEAGLGSIKIREKLTGSLEGDALRIYRQSVERWEIPGLEAKNSLVVGTWIRRIAGGHVPGRELPCWKYAALVDLLLTQLKNEQVVVWFSFNLELARVWRELKAANISATWVSGEVEVPERRRRRSLFHEGKRRVFLCQVACGKYGLDLSAADTEIYFSSPYSFEGRRQSEDRLEHPLKKAPILVVDLVTERTVDEDVLESLAAKNESAQWLMTKIQTNRRLG
jgi:hypothetical protein